MIDFEIDVFHVVQMKFRRRYWLIIFDWYRKNESIETLIELLDLTTTILYCVHFAIDIDVIVVVVVVYNFDIIETIDIEFDFVVLIYHDYF